MKEVQKYSIDFIENVDSLDQNELESLKGGKDQFCDCFCLINFGSNDEPAPEEPDED
ncbi:hypothetical protein L21SP5_01228 [Salinivirga cyanobacteriivorans]|uniref:Uncharacterized protein n=1 Tax=Salinivirga cyanobacteriivorans TaxID=1307839 RepID=A0A0S2HXR8_9BACT|nr:hypothetical protein [Salinivirga cyanobacteriivorans]ALO14883.1 hypothetical protein L21SP5_01228 [Salinivirga cyanobacteriivorans]